MGHSCGCEHHGYGKEMVGYVSLFFLLKYVLHIYELDVR